MPRKPFKNALCLERRPDAWVESYSHRCKRHANHKGQHRVVYSGGVTVFWETGDKETIGIKKEK